MAVQCCGEHMHTETEMRIHNDRYHSEQTITPKLIRLTITDFAGNSISRVIAEREPVPPSWFRNGLSMHLEIVDEAV